MRGVIIITEKTQKQPKYKSIPKQVSRKDFNKKTLFHGVANEGEIPTWVLPDSAISRLGQGRIMSDIAYSPDGKFITFGSAVGLWWYDLSTMTPIALWDTDRGFISTVSFSADGRWLATGDGDGLVKIWDVQHRICIAQMERDEDEKSHHLVSYLVFSPDCQRLAVSSVRDYILYVYHPETGQRLAKLNDDPNKFRWRGYTRRPITFSSDSRLLACPIPDNSLDIQAKPGGTIHLPENFTEFIAVWNIETQEQLACLTNTDGVVRSICFSPCGRFLAAGGRGGSVRIWSVDNWQQTQQYLDFFGTGRMQLFYSPSGILYASQKSDETFVVWDVASGEKCDLSLDEHSSLQGVPVPKGTPFVLPFNNPREFRKWRVDDSEPNSMQHLHTGVPFSLVFASDGKTLAGGYWNKGEEVMLWDISKPSLMPTCVNLPGSYVVSASPQGNIYAAGVNGNSAKVWKIGNSETPIATFTLPNENSQLAVQEQQVSTAAFAHKTNLMACGDSEGTMYVWDVQQQLIQHTLKAHSEWINFIAFSPDEKNIVSMTRTGPVSKLWNVESCEFIKAFPERNYAFAFSPCSTLIALAQIGRPSEIELWNIKCCETIIRIPQPKDSTYPFALAFSPCGRFLASGATWIRGFGIKKCPVLLWDVASGENITAFRGHPTDVQDLAFSPDGKLLASGSYDGTILIWDMTPYLL